MALSGLYTRSWALRGPAKAETRKPLPSACPLCTYRRSEIRKTADAPIQRTSRGTAAPSRRPRRTAALGGHADGIHADIPTGSDDEPSHLPVMLLLAQARLAALEDFRAAVAVLHASPLQGAGGAFDIPAALAHFARFANPSADPAAARAEVMRLAAAVEARAATMLEIQEGLDKRHPDGPVPYSAAAATGSHSSSSSNLAMGGFVAPSASNPANSPFAPALWGTDGAAESASIYSGGDIGGALASTRAAEGLTRRLLALVSVMEEEGFKGNFADPWDPANTYIDTLLERKMGTPRSLALLWTAVAAAAGLPLATWAFPGDGVLLKLQLPAGAGGALLADPVNPGQLLLLPEYDAADEDYLNNAVGGSGYSRLSADAAATNADSLSDAEAARAARRADGWGEIMQMEGSRLGGLGVKVLGPAAASELEPLPLRRLLGYALMDVKRMYLMTDMMEEALGVIRYMRALDPWSAGDLRDEGLVLYSLGRHHEARAPLATYLEAAGPSAPDAGNVIDVLARIESLLSPPPSGGEPSTGGGPSA